MSIVTETTTTYDAVGIREDLADVIYDISPMDTPILSGASKGDVDNTLFEWQTDSLASTDTGNAQLEGDDIASFPSAGQPTRVGNRTQISRKLVNVSGTQEAVDTAGRASEIARETTRRGQELKRDIEAILLSNQASAAGDESTARQTATLGAWLQSNTDFEGTGADSGHSSGVPGSARTDGVQRALTETIFKSVIQSVWENGGNVDNLIAYPGPFNKGVISGFEGIATHTVNIGEDNPGQTVVVAAVDVYVSDFGNVRIVPNRFGRERDLYLLDFEYLQVDHLRPFRLENLAKTGDAEKRMLLQEWGLRVKQEAALGGIFDLNSS